MPAMDSESRTIPMAEPPPANPSVPFRADLVPGPTPVSYVTEGWPPTFHWPPLWWTRWRGVKTPPLQERWEPAKSSPATSWAGGMPPRSSLDSGGARVPPAMAPPANPSSPFRHDLVPGPTPVSYVTEGWPPTFDWPPKWWTRWRAGKDDPGG